jgi:hypothetical protein
MSPGSLLPRAGPVIKPEELDKLKLNAKHTINTARFVDWDEIDSRYFEKPYYLLPDGDDADEAMSSCAMRWLRAGRSLSANSSCTVASTWSASRLKGKALSS